MGMNPTGEPDREERLNEVLLAYVEALEAGREPDRGQLLAAHPDLRPDLEAFFAGHDEVERLAAPAASRGAGRRPRSGRPAARCGRTPRTRASAELGRLPPPARGRPRRHGRRLRGRADLARPAGGAEGAAVRRGARPAAAAALPERGAGGGAPAPREHRAGLRRRLRARRPLLRHAVHRGPDPRRADRGAAPARDEQAPAHARPTEPDDRTASTLTVGLARVGPGARPRSPRRPSPASGRRTAAGISTGWPGWAGRRRRRWSTPTRRGSSTATSSRPTCCSTARAALGHRLRPGPGHAATPA